MPLERTPIRSITAQFLMPCLPLPAERVTGHAMLLIAAAIASALPQDAPSQPVRPVVQARAAVRIVSGVRVQFDQKASGMDVPRAKSAVVQTTEGPQRAMLVEFE